MKTAPQPTLKSYILQIEGLVQGVGFRPFIHRLASELNLKGNVENRNNGVFIKINASESQLKFFEDNIRIQSPPASEILSITTLETKSQQFDDFQIVKSNSLSMEITQVSPDIAVCKDCLNDIQNQPHRLDYSFVNCTNCGPRFSIVKELPYDRPFTTMQEFRMCKECASEYGNVLDRRFHAQPIACNHCGPQYLFHAPEKTLINIAEILHELSQGVLDGKVFAVKGIGGFHLMCDARNETAVARIREIKNRDGKPFAIMAQAIQALTEIADVSEKECELLNSWQRPIVILNYKGGLAASLTNGLKKVGVMLPYMPFHYQLFKILQNQLIVLTSGNISDEPIIIENGKAFSILKDKTDGIISYNRDIHNRVDDSVCSVINNTVRINRRSRGFAPKPIITALNTEGIFAAGAELVNSFCIGKGNQMIMSQYLGDMKNMETLEFYEETYIRFEKLFRFKPELIVSDFHPDYLSSRFAQSLSENLNIPIVTAQHHHAHTASVMVSNKLDCEVIAVSYDGIGLGSDGNIWGAEFLKADLAEFERLFHFENIPMPGGDLASKEPWRMAISYLYAVFGEELVNLDLPVLKQIQRSKILNVIQMLKKKINSPLASSAGRLFDAVASLTGIAHFNTFQAEAPMRLESIINKGESGNYQYEIKSRTVSFNPMIRQIANDVTEGISHENISTKFHNTIINLTIDICSRIAAETKLKKIVLSGGTFQNVYLTENIENSLKSAGFEVYLPLGIPVNDQGISLGQLAIAAKRRSPGKK
jgi:hydrogenase maturation protein HypF